MSDDRRPVEAPFNMALSTLEHLRGILKQINDLSLRDDLTMEIKQSMKLNLVKDFYITSSPLLKIKTEKDGKEKIETYDNLLDIKAVEKQILIQRAGNSPIFKGIVPKYDFALEKKLNLILISIQKDLQASGFFMPPRRDLGKSVTEF